VGSVLIRMASSAPIARAFLMVGSVCGPPTVATWTVAPCFSLNHMARVSPNSSLGLITNCTSVLSNWELSAEKFILEVVSGTLLIQTKIFISRYLYGNRIDILRKKMVILAV